MNKGSTPFTSVIVPCRNEEKFISSCIDSILDNDFPHESLEILIVDGMSSDLTREILEEYSENYSFIKVLFNQKKIVSSALNLGINAARGEIILRMDAHNIYPKDYISKCISHLIASGFDNVGGILVTRPGDDSLRAASIAAALSHPFGVGNSFYRIGTDRPRLVDTVPFGCYRREVFTKIGLFDEDLVRNQDDELNSRLLGKGGKILLVPEIVSYYYARRNLSSLWRMNYQYGYFKPLAALKASRLFTIRQLAPPLFTSGLLVSLVLSIFGTPFPYLFLAILGSYLFADIIFSFLIVRKGNARRMFILPIIFPIMHISYGLGYLKGLLDFLLLRKDKRKKGDGLPLTR